MRAERLDQAVAEVGVILIDHGDGDVADKLSQVWLRIEDRVEEGGEDEQAKDAAVGEDAAPLRKKGTADSGPMAILRFLFNRRSEAGAGQRTEAQPHQE